MNSYSQNNLCLYKTYLGLTCVHAVVYSQVKKIIILVSCPKVTIISAVFLFSRWFYYLTQLMFDPLIVTDVQKANHDPSDDKDKVTDQGFFW